MCVLLELHLLLDERQFARSLLRALLPRILKRALLLEVARFDRGRLGPQLLQTFLERLYP